MKLALIIACLGHIICGVTDCMLAYTPEGRFDFKNDTKDLKRMRKLFEKMPLKQVELSMLIGVFSLFAAGFGYIGLSRWAEQFSQISGTIMYISGMFFIVPIAAHHVLCGAVEWFFIKLGRTDEAFEKAHKKRRSQYRERRFLTDYNVFNSIQNVLPFPTSDIALHTPPC